MVMGMCTNKPAEVNKTIDIIPHSTRSIPTQDEVGELGGSKSISAREARSKLA